MKRMGITTAIGGWGNGITDDGIGNPGTVGNPSTTTIAIGGWGNG